MKLPIEELMDAVKEELLCYENMEAHAEKWSADFQTFLKKNKGKHKDILEEKGKVYFKITDEGEIFEIADSYIDALEEGTVKKYWDTF